MTSISSRADADISVILPARNCAPWIGEAVASLLRQRTLPSEILIADDDSQDSTVRIIEELSSPLIRVLRSHEQLGISQQINRLIQESKGRFIARMDGDDIAHPLRFQSQIASFTITRASVIGTWASRFGRSRHLHRPPSAHNDILAHMGFSNPMITPTMMLDRHQLGTLPLHDPHLAYGADFKFLTELKGRARFHNIPEALLAWRLHESNVGADSKSAILQCQTVSAVRAQIWREAGIQLSQRQEVLLDKVSFGPPPDFNELEEVLETFKLVLLRPEASLWSTYESIRSNLLQHWSYLCRLHGWGRFGTLQLWLRGVRDLGGKLEPNTIATLILKSVARTPTKTKPLGQLK